MEYKTVNKSGNKRGCNRRSEETKQKISNSRKLRFEMKRGLALVPQLQDYIADALIRQDENGTPFSVAFIDNFLQEARKKPDSPSGKTLASLMFSPDLLQSLDKRVNDEQNKNIDFQLYRIRQTMYDRQQEVFDNNNDKTIMNFSGRRAGKSELNQRILLKYALKYKNSICIYINRNFDNAITQGYDTMVKVLDTLNIQYTGSRGNGLITLFNGTEIYYRGASNTVDIDRFRGVSKMACAIIDEAGHLKGLRYLLTEVLQPATIDIADSQIIMTGTPPRTKGSYAYQLWFNNKANIKRYNWNFLSNPFIPNRDAVISEVAKLYGVAEDSAFIRREYLGDMSALDDDAKIFNNIYTLDRPLNNRVYERLYFGIDWGYEDEAAISCFLVDKENKKMIQIGEWHASHKSISEIAVALREMYDKWTNHYKCAKLPYIICDNNEKSAVLDLATVYHFKNVLTAYKYEKSMALKQLSSFMNTQNVSLLPDSYLYEEADNMIWKRDPETDKIIEELDDEVFHANGMMSALYVSRQFAYDIMGYIDRNKPAKELLKNG